MSIQRIVVQISLALGGLGAIAAAPVQAGEWPLKVMTVAGHAETQSGGAAAWTAAKLRAELNAGAAARTLEGRLTLKTPSGQSLRLAPVSRVVLREARAPDQPTAARLDAGMVWVAVLPGSPAPERLEVQTAPATVVVEDGGVEIALGRDGAAVVRVYHGAATCSGPGTERQWNRALGAGQELVIPSGARPGETRKLDRDRIDPAWAKWNEDQDLAGGYGGKPSEK